MQKNFQKYFFLEFYRKLNKHLKKYLFKFEFVQENIEKLLDSKQQRKKLVIFSCAKKDLTPKHKNNPFRYWNETLNVSHRYEFYFVSLF